MDSESKVKLIKLVKTHDILYNKVNTRSSNYMKIQNTWTGINYALNIPEINAKHEWRKIRKNYYFATVINLERMFEKYKKIKLYKYEKELYFLLRYFEFPKKYKYSSVLYIEFLDFLFRCTKNEIVQTYRNKTEDCSCIQGNNYQHHFTNSLPESSLSRNSQSVVQTYNDNGLYYNQGDSETNSLNYLSNYFTNNPKIQNQGSNYFQSDVRKPGNLFYPSQINTISSYNKSDASESHYFANTSGIFDSSDYPYLPDVEEPSYESHSLQWNTYLPSATKYTPLTYIPETNNQTFFTHNTSDTETNTLPYSTQLNKEIFSHILPAATEYNGLAYSPQNFSLFLPESTISNALSHSYRI